MSRKAAPGPWRVSWRTVGAACGRVYGEPLERSGGSLLRGPRRIGVDETSHKKGRRHATAVVDHDRGRVVWAHEGYGKEALALFLDELGAANGGEGCCVLSIAFEQNSHRDLSSSRTDVSMTF